MLSILFMREIKILFEDIKYFIGMSSKVNPVKTFTICILNLFQILLKLFESIICIYRIYYLKNI